MMRRDGRFKVVLEVWEREAFTRSQREAFSRAAPARLKGSPSGHLIEPTKRLLRAHAERRKHEHDPRSRIVDQRKQPIAALETERRSAFEEKRH
ncbi:MAG TPA: hypothetical protein VKH42_03735, partial [Vicinamibacterales bacterium]|nr:hypothetical protein [Vicinamibacterales bacterium]